MTSIAHFKALIEINPSLIALHIVRGVQKLNQFSIVYVSCGAQNQCINFKILYDLLNILKNSFPQLNCVNTQTQRFRQLLSYNFLAKNVF